MEQDWITDRLPTETDGDENGEVWLRNRRSSAPKRLVHFSYVHPGAPWQHTGIWKPPAEPAPTEPDRIAARRVVQIAFHAVDAERSCLIALCSDGSLWCLHAFAPEWTQLPAIPQP